MGQKEHKQEMYISVVLNWFLVLTDTSEEFGPTI